MMGFGSHGNGGTYSSSSTVDRSVPKPPSKSPVDLTEPSYAAPWNSSLHNWLPSHSPASGPKLFSNPSLEFSSVPSTNAYKYGGLRNIESSNSHLPPSSTVAPAATNSYSYIYGQRSEIPKFQCSDERRSMYIYPYVYPYSSPHLRFHDADVSDAGANLTKSNRGQSTPTPTPDELVNTICNLSALLHLHCTNGSCELKRSGFEIQIVIMILNMCISESISSTFPMKMCSVANSVLEDNISENDSSHLHMENIPSVTNLTKSSNRGQSTPTTDVPGLVNTMSNLSELLLLHCTNHELKQKDVVAVKSVIINLGTCMSKNVEKGVPIHDATSSQKNNSKSNEVHKGELDVPNDLQGKKHYLSGKKDDKISDSFAVRDDLEEKMTQALKKVLGENFYDEEETQPQTLLYKNLWLEAEAALCSINCKARFNRMKLEMEKSELPKSEDVCENTMVMKKLSGSSRSEVSEYLPKEIQNSSIRNISSQDDNVMARIGILRCPVYIPDSLNPAISSLKVSPDPNKADQKTFEEHKANGSLKSDGTKNFTNDFEASVMDRFHILKSRNDNCSSNCTEGQVDLGYAGKRRSNVKMESMVQQNSANSTEVKLTVKDFHLFVDEDPLVQSRSSTNRSGNQLVGSRETIS